MAPTGVWAVSRGWRRVAIAGHEIPQMSRIEARIDCSDCYPQLTATRYPSASDRSPIATHSTGFL